MANGLGALLARKNQQQNSDQAMSGEAPTISPESPAATPTPPVAAGDTSLEKQETVDVAPRKANPFGRKTASAGQPPATAASSQESVVVAGTVGGGQDAAIRAAAGGSVPRLAGLKFGGTVRQADADNRPSEPVVGTDSSFDSLEELAASVEEGIAPKPTRSTFADETPATKPTRDLPPELQKQQLQFVDLLDGMYEIVHDPELLGNVVKSMMIELGANPQYEKLLAPADVRLVVRAARDSMGLARVKKTEAKAKRSGAAGARAAKAVDSDMLADLADLGIGGLE